MQRITLFTFVFTIISAVALAEPSEPEPQKIADMMEQELHLAPFMKQVQDGEVSPGHTAILYSILQNTSEVCIHQQNGAKDNKVYLAGGIRRALAQQDRPETEWKSDGQLQALAVFLRAIHEGKAESLFALFDSESKVSNKQLIEVLTKLNRGLERVYSVPTKEPEATR